MPRSHLQIESTRTTKSKLLVVSSTSVITFHSFTADRNILTPVLQVVFSTKSKHILSNHQYVSALLLWYTVIQVPEPVYNTARCFGQLWQQAEWPILFCKPTWKPALALHSENGWKLGGGFETNEWTGKENKKKEIPGSREKVLCFETINVEWIWKEIWWEEIPGNCEKVCIMAMLWNKLCWIWTRKEIRKEEIPGNREKVCMAMLWNKLWWMDREGN